jgi:hypothetical protein
MNRLLGVLFTAVCAGGLLIAGSSPRFIGGAVIAPYEDTLREIARGKIFSGTVLKDTETALRVSRKWVDSGETAASLGAMRFIAARSMTQPEAQRAALRESMAALKHGLSRMPAQPYVWLQLAQAERALNGTTPSIEKYLAMSLALAPWEHRLVLSRLDLALGAWSVLSPEFKSGLPRQFERAVDTAPVGLAQAARRNFALRPVRQMLAGSPVHLDRFQLVYLSLY